MTARLYNSCVCNDSILQGLVYNVHGRMFTLCILDMRTHYVLSVFDVRPNVIDKHGATCHSINQIPHLYAQGWLGVSNRLKRNLAFSNLWWLRDNYKAQWDTTLSMGFDFEWVPMCLWIVEPVLVCPVHGDSE